IYRSAYRIFYMCLVGLVLSSCNKLLDIDTFHAASEEQQWNKLEDARAGLMGVYGLTRAALAENNGHWMYGELRMGDFTVRDGANRESDLRAVTNNQLSKPSFMLQELANW